MTTALRPEERNQVRSSQSRRIGRRGSAVLVVLVSMGIGATLLLLSQGRPDPDRLWSAAERAFLSGDWAQARAMLDRLAKLRPRTGLDWMLVAQLATAEGKFDLAFAAVDSIADSHPIAPQAHLLAGRLHRQLRCLRKAESSFRRALALKPGLIDAHKELIYILGIQSRRSEIDAEFLQLGKLTLLTHHDLFTWALTHFTHWNPDIVADLDSFIKADPDDRYSRLAVVELLLERPEVESYVMRILDPLPDTDPDALALRINLAFNLGQIDKAESLLARAPANHPRLARIRGEIALRRHDLDEAIRQFRQALSSEPYDRVSPMQLAQVLRLKGETADADAYLDRFKRLSRVYNVIMRIRSPRKENQITDLAELGAACEDAHLDEEARSWYRLAITVNPLDPVAQRGLCRLVEPATTASRP